jgi:hypothetical protein
MDRLHIVKIPFTAATLWVGAKSRNFNPGEILWFDDEDRSGIFRADGFKWFAEDIIEFIESIEPLPRTDALRQRAASQPDSSSSLRTRMMKDERAVKAKRGIWKFSWGVVGLLVVILAAVLMAFMTCRRRTQEPFREREATSRQESKSNQP